MTCQLRLTKRLFLIAVSAAIISSVLPPNSAAAITLGQADNFQDGGLHGWVGGGAGGVASAQMNIPGGGPSGAEDNYLQLSAGGTGGAPRLLGYNQSQWTGDFLAAGVSGVAMDLLNSGASALSIRIAVREGTGNSGTPGYASTNAFNLPPDNAWHHALFLLDAADLTGVNSPQALTIDLANVKEFRILDSASVSLLGDQFSNSSPAVAFGVDNITAVPEPSGVFLFALGAALLGLAPAFTHRWDQCPA